MEGYLASAVKRFIYKQRNAPVKIDDVVHINDEIHNYIIKNEVNML